MMLIKKCAKIILCNKLWLSIHWFIMWFWLLVYICPCPFVCPHFCKHFIFKFYFFSNTIGPSKVKTKKKCYWKPRTITPIWLQQIHVCTCVLSVNFGNGKPKLGPRKNCYFDIKKYKQKCKLLKTHEGFKVQYRNILIIFFICRKNYNATIREMIMQISPIV